MSQTCQLLKTYVYDFRREPRIKRNDHRPFSFKGYGFHMIDTNTVGSYFTHRVQIRDVFGKLREIEISDKVREVNINGELHEQDHCVWSAVRTLLEQELSEGYFNPKKLKRVLRLHGWKTDCPVEETPKKQLEKQKKGLKEKAVYVPVVTRKGNDIIFRIGKKKRKLSIEKTLELYNQLPSEIAERFRKSFGVKINAKKTRKAILKVLSTTTLTPDKYFEHEKSSGRFIPQYLAEDIMQKITFMTCNDNEDMYYYDEKEGIWRSNGEFLIKKLGTTLLQEKTKRHYLLETINYIQAKTYVDRKIFDSPPLNLIPLKNGVLNLKTKTLKPYHPNYYFTAKLAINYNANAKCPKINKFIGEIVSENDKELLYEFPAYCLYRRYPIQKAFMLLGGGANGKSTYIQLVTNTLGKENVSSVTLQTLATNRFSAAELYKKLANIAADLPSSALKNTGLFKMLTGGDTVRGEKKFKHAFFFLNYAKLMFSANRVPFTEDESEAFYRRWIIINFPYKFEGDKDNKFILQEITTEEELSGFLNEMLHRYDKILKKGFSYTKTTLETKEMYIKTSDPIGAFVTEKIVQASKGVVTKHELYNAYIEYCKTRKLPIVYSNIFSKNLRKYIKVEDCRPKIKGKRVTAWRGIELIKDMEIKINEESSDSKHDS